jgi:hypothetical protein
MSQLALPYHHIAPDLLHRHLLINNPLRYQPHQLYQLCHLPPLLPQLKPNNNRIDQYHS